MQARPIRLRRARRTDFGAIRTLLDGVGLPSPTVDRGGLRRFRRLVADLGSDLYVALRDERIVGVVQVTYCRHLLFGQEAQLALLAVAADLQRQGIGRALLARAILRARKRGCARLHCAPPAGEWERVLVGIGWRADGGRLAIDLAQSAPAQ